MSGYFAHPSAVVDGCCRIGNRTAIWHFTHVCAGAEIGNDCVLGQNVLVSSGVTLGNDVHVQNNVSLYTGLTCEDGVFLGPSCVFTNVRTPRSLVPRKTQYLPTRVCHGATVGANATVLCGCTVGAYALVGAGAVVTHNVPSHALVYGTPARIHGWVCRCGARLHFLGGVAHCPECGFCRNICATGKKEKESNGKSKRTAL